LNRFELDMLNDWSTFIYVLFSVGVCNWSANGHRRWVVTLDKMDDTSPTAVTSLYPDWVLRSMYPYNVTCLSPLYYVAFTSSVLCLLVYICAISYMLESDHNEQ